MLLGMLIGNSSVVGQGESEPTLTLPIGELIATVPETYEGRVEAAECGLTIRSRIMPAVRSARYQDCRHYRGRRRISAAPASRSGPVRQLMCSSC